LSTESRVPNKCKSTAETRRERDAEKEEEDRAADEEDENEVVDRLAESWRNYSSEKMLIMP